jgi:hypothetical protein
MAILATCLMISLIVLIYPLRIIPVGYVLPALAFWETNSVFSLLASAFFSVGLAGVGILFTKERYVLNQNRYYESFLATEKRFSFIGSLRSMLAKEWLELRRSGSLFPVVTGFAGQLMGIYLILWIFKEGFGIPLNFNLVFFSGFVGFIGAMNYGLLTNIEHNEYFNVMPVTVDSIVKAKLTIYFVITSFVTLGYVFFIGFLKGEMYYIPMSLLVCSSTSIYAVIVIAYLTGLWTNTMFFGASTIIKFSLIVVPPLTVIEIASIMLQFNSQIAVMILLGVSVSLIIISYVIFTQLEKKWKNTQFSYVLKVH